MNPENRNQLWWENQPYEKKTSLIGKSKLAEVWQTTHSSLKSVILEYTEWQSETNNTKDPKWDSDKATEIQSQLMQESRA